MVYKLNWSTLYTMLSYSCLEGLPLCSHGNLFWSFNYCIDSNSLSFKYLLYYAESCFSKTLSALHKQACFVHNSLQHSLYFYLPPWTLSHIYNHLSIHSVMLSQNLSRSLLYARCSHGLWSTSHLKLSTLWL